MPSAELSSRHVAEAHRQIEQALQTADQQIEALKARVTKKHAQLSSAKLQLERHSVNGMRRQACQTLKAVSRQVGFASLVPVLACACAGFHGIVSCMCTCLVLASTTVCT